jgi:transcriptional regulator with XRE-family HTH domain
MEIRLLARRKLMSKSIGETIKRLREQNGLSTRELSEAINKGAAYISQLERNIIKKPKLTTLITIFETLNCKKEEIYNTLTEFGYNMKPPVDPINIDVQVKMGNILGKTTTITSLKELEEKIKSLQHDNLRNFEILKHFINIDVSRSETVIQNMNRLLSNKETFNFFVQFFSIDFTKFEVKKLEEIIHLITNNNTDNK